jgi:hypothetical protein
MDAIKSSKRKGRRPCVPDRLVGATTARGADEHPASRSGGGECRSDHIWRESGLWRPALTSTSEAHVAPSITSRKE